MIHCLVSPDFASSLPAAAVLELARCTDFASGLCTRSHALLGDAGEAAPSSQALRGCDWTVGGLGAAFFAGGGVRIIWLAGGSTLALFGGGVCKSCFSAILSLLWLLLETSNALPAGSVAPKAAFSFSLTSLPAALLGRCLDSTSFGEAASALFWPSGVSKMTLPWTGRRGEAARPRSTSFCLCLPSCGQDQEKITVPLVASKLSL
mmetsp:Transcript_85149/g.150630  ORF Transcript_85149/g.150630 Transcript_85149/m.150630 type:complete len:206 (-) Transcript_85149:2017-2634(-)